MLLALIIENKNLTGTATEFLPSLHNKKINNKIPIAMFL